MPSSGLRHGSPMTTSSSCDYPKIRRRDVAFAFIAIVLFTGFSVAIKLWGWAGNQEQILPSQAPEFWNLQTKMDEKLDDILNRLPPQAKTLGKER